MTATRVECREFGVESSGPRVEEVASYAYTVQDETSKTPQNGVLIEEYSEPEQERRSNTAANRGVTIVSVSDDESTLKALSRDVSTEDVQTADQLPDDQNGIVDDFCFNGTPEMEKTLEDIRARRVRVAETIVEEQSEEQPLSAVLSDTARTPRRESLEVKETRTSSRSSTISDAATPARQVAEMTLDHQADSAVELARETARHDETKISALSSETLERQNSRKAQLDDEEIDEEMKDLLNRVKRQRSVLDEILDRESGRESGNEITPREAFHQAASAANIFPEHSSKCKLRIMF